MQILGPPPSDLMHQKLWMWDPEICAETSSYKGTPDGLCRLASELLASSQGAETHELKSQPALNSNFHTSICF